MYEKEKELFAEMINIVAKLKKTDLRISGSQYFRRS